MRASPAAILIGAAVAIGVATAAAAAASGDGEPIGVSPELREQFQEAVKDAGLEGQPVRGKYVPGEGWQVEKAPTTEEGWTPYGPSGS